MEPKTNQDLAFRKLQQVLLLRFSTWKQRYEMLEQKYIELLFIHHTHNPIENQEKLKIIVEVNSLNGLPLYVVGLRPKPYNTY